MEIPTLLSDTKLDCLRQFTRQLQLIWFQKNFVSLSLRCCLIVTRTVIEYNRFHHPLIKPHHFLSSVLRKTRLNVYNNENKLTNETFEKIQRFRKGLPENQKMPLENLLRQLLKKTFTKHQYFITAHTREMVGRARGSGGQSVDFGRVSLALQNTQHFSTKVYSATVQATVECRRRRGHGASRQITDKHG